MAAGLLVELSISSCYDFLEQYCLHISSHLANMSKQRECPEDCREVVSTLMFAAARFSDLPELRELRAIFNERYGNSIECFVNKEFVTKLKSQPPTTEMNLQLMQEIAVESGVRWNSKALEQNLSKPLIALQDLSKSHNDEEHKLHKKADESAQRKIQKKLSLIMRMQGRIRLGRESDKQKRDNLSRRSLDGTPPIKDIEEDIIGRKGQQNEPKIIKSVSEEKSDDKKPFYYSPIQPSYANSRACISKSSSDASPTVSTMEAQRHAEMNQRGVQIAKEEDTSVNDAIKKPKPKSVRTRLQPMRGCEDSDRLRCKDRGKGLTTGVKGVARDGNHGIKIANSDQRNEEEKMMDRLLMHYTRKQAQIELKTPKSVVKLLKLPEVETSEVSRKRFPASIPVELKQASLVTLREGHDTQKNFFEHDVMSPNGLIHPKLPDYDDFVTRLAALKLEVKEQHCS
ncbi:hypothetical protein HAX54_024914 [Datura stramonium]|uniref:Regulator of Vps4 activity in the MVB pathway protein n=1 Tax=Datura stramonium TaxID=4076 RepID=A0ABS8V076_DATST|nr:hypothetical protein [Datura stramonium]